MGFKEWLQVVDENLAGLVNPQGNYNDDGYNAAGATSKYFGGRTPKPSLPVDCMMTGDNCPPGYNPGMKLKKRRKVAK